MRVQIVTTLAMAALISTATIGFSGTSDNDGGLGVDAGNTVSSALLLASLGSLHGNLSAVDDRDWFYTNPADSSAPTCTSALLTSQYPTQMRLAAVQTTDAREVVAAAPGGRTGVAAVGNTGTFVEAWGPALEMPPLRSYHVASAAAALSTTQSNDNDAGLGVDVTPASPGVAKACMLGALKANVGDTADAYTFSGTAGKKVMLSASTFADKADKLTVTLADPSGSTVATLVSGDLIQVTLPSTGMYTMSASTSYNGGVPYALGLCEPECTPPANPCRPSCMNMAKD